MADPFLISAILVIISIYIRAALSGIGATLSVVFTIPLHSSFERGDGRVAIVQRGINGVAG